MRTTLDRVLVIDVESTCWEGNPPDGEESEIIEIGWCILDARSRQRGESGSILVRPARSRISEFCTGLTTLNQEQVDTGISFEEACRMLRQEKDSRSVAWASFGNYDRKMFQRQCQSTAAPYPFGDTHINVKNLFALMHGLPKEIGMDGAMEMIGIPLEGTHHRGGDDAKNIAAILAMLLWKATV